MKPLIWELEQRISEAMIQHASIPGSCPAIVRPTNDPSFGDYQVNGVMGLAKRINADPVATANAVGNSSNLSDLCTWKVAGPGFINLTLKPEYVAERLLEINEDTASLAVDKADTPKTIVVDFSSPNIAKQMHVGHLRSTIIGDAICRMHEFLGHTVIRQNHIGDWGLQTGMIVHAVLDGALAASNQGDLLDRWYDGSYSQIDEAAMKTALDGFQIDLDGLEAAYRELTARIKAGDNVVDRVRAATVYLHGDDPIAQLAWEKARRITLGECYRIYKILGVSLEDGHTHGESAYRDDLPKVVHELKNRELAEKSDRAICVFPEGFRNKEGEPLPFIIQKSDGAYLYATTDLAALRYRVDKLGADVIVYVTDSRQKMHFEMLFAVARMAGWDVRQETGDRRQKTEDGRQKTEDGGERTELVHVMFGSILGEDGTPLKTRSGENVKLKELLDEAIERAMGVVEEKNPELSAEKKGEIAKAVGIGAVKYADYNNNRTSDYVFSFDKMLAMEGNTAPYMQYAYARIKSIERKAESREVDIETELAGLEELSLAEPAELDLAKYLIRYGEAIASAAGDYRPNYLTTYLYELSQKFSTFYANCPVLKAEPEKRPSRLLLCDLTARTIRHGLTELLGISVVEQM